MKKLIILFLLLLSFVIAKAQTSLKNAADFSALSTDGSLLQLTKYLDEGRSVILFFYFSGCPSCNDAVDKLNMAYLDFGCDEKGVKFIAINADNKNLNEQTLKPIFSEILSSEIAKIYGISAFPTTVLIDPDRSISKNDIWLMDQAGSEFYELGLKPHSCDENLFVTDVKVYNESKYLVYPNPATDFINISFTDIVNTDLIFMLSDLSGRNIPVNTVSGENGYLIDINELIPGMYFLNVSFNGANSVIRIIKN